MVRIGLLVSKKEKIIRVFVNNPVKCCNFVTDIIVII